MRLERFIDARSWARRQGTCRARRSSKRRKRGHAVADLIEREDAGVETVVEVGGEVGDLVGQVDQLRFKGRTLVKEILGQFRMALRPE